MDRESLEKACLKLDMNTHYVPEAGCHIYAGVNKKKGYGTIKVGNKNYSSHRVAWEREYGEIPRGLSVLHKCDTPSCCNPAHLWLGTNQQNVDDCVAKGRRFTKLTPSQVEYIRSSTDSIISMANRFSVSRFAVSDAKKGKTWNKCLRPEYEK